MQHLIVNTCFTGSVQFVLPLCQASPKHFTLNLLRSFLGNISIFHISNKHFFMILLFLNHVKIICYVFCRTFNFLYLFFTYTMFSCISKKCFPADTGPTCPFCLGPSKSMSRPWGKRGENCFGWTEVSHFAV
jgi:hypothetical protein